jgi:hypothetical protein
MRLAEADYSLTAMAFGKSSPDDARLMVRFELFPQINAGESESQGRPIYEDVDYITIIVPGDKDSIVHRKVWSQDMQRFPQQWAAYKSNQSQEAADGTPLSAWPPIAKSQILELAFFNVKTVDQLANLADAHAHKFAGINKLRNLAREWLAQAKDAAHITKIQAELAQRDSQIEVNARTISDLGARLAAMESLLKERGD